MSDSRRSLPRIHRSLGAALVAAQILAAGIGIRASLPAIQRRGVVSVISPAQRRDVRFIRGWIPDDEPLLYLSDGRDRWAPRLWERALSPEPVAFASSRDLPRDAIALRRRFRIHWAISAGTPPADPGFAWHLRLAPLPGSPAEYWFGRLTD